MKEITGNLWDYYGKPNHVCIVTTNGTVKNNGECVMGRGCAAEAKEKVPGIASCLGAAIRKNGNVFHGYLGAFVGDYNGQKLAFFPVKHNWWEKADLVLIKQSTNSLKTWAEALPEFTFILPRPGCGNGQRTWSEVKPLLEGLPDNVWVISREA